MFLSKKSIFQFILLFIFALSSMSCATIGRQWKALVGGKSDNPQTPVAAAPVTSFSNTPDVMLGKDRKYHRVTVDNFNDQQALDDNAGSLWRKEGQGSYLFSQNSLRNIGDIINVQMDGKAAENLNSKLSIIKQALARVESPIIVKRTIAEAGVPKPEDKTAQVNTPNNPNNNIQSPPEPANSEEEKAREAVNQKFDDVPCRIVESSPDGSYRVKGATSVFVGRHEYKLIVTGIIRPEDVSNDDAVLSSRVLDSKFDLLATNKDVKK